MPKGTNRTQPSFCLLWAVTSALALTCIAIAAVIFLDPAVITYYAAPRACVLGSDLVVAFKQESVFRKAAKFVCMKKEGAGPWKRYFHLYGELGALACRDGSMYLFRGKFYSIHSEGRWLREPAWERPWRVSASANVGDELFAFGVDGNTNLSVARLDSDGWHFDLPQLPLSSPPRKLSAAAETNGCLLAFEDRDAAGFLQLVRFAAGQWGPIKRIPLPDVGHFALCSSETGTLLFYTRPEGKLRPRSRIYYRRLDSELQEGAEQAIDEGMNWPRTISGLAAARLGSSTWIFATGLRGLVAADSSDGAWRETQDLARTPLARRMEAGFWYGLILLLPVLFAAVGFSVLRTEESLWMSSFGRPLRRFPMLLRRGLAQALDVPLVLPLYLAAVPISPGLPIILRVVTFLALALGYMFLTEWLFQQTLGKAICGIAVTGAFGEKPSASACFRRNLLRLVDFLPAFYIAGLLAMRITGADRRLGDLLAHTEVVRWERGKPVDPTA